MKYIGKYPDTTGRNAKEFYCDLMQTTLGERIKLYRKASGKTQSELGELCGVNPANLRKYESGRQNPKYETLERIARALDSAVYIIYSPEDFAADYMVKSGILSRWFDEISIEEAKRSAINPDEILGELLDTSIHDLSAHGHDKFTLYSHTRCEEAVQANQNDTLNGSALTAIPDDKAGDLAYFARLCISAGNTLDAGGATLAQVERLLQDFNKLTPIGREKALERVHELTEVPRYTFPAVTPAPASAAESTQTAPQSPAGHTDTHK